MDSRTSPQIISDKVRSSHNANGSSLGKFNPYAAQVAAPRTEIAALDAPDSTLAAAGNSIQGVARHRGVVWIRPPVIVSSDAKSIITDRVQQAITFALDIITRTAGMSAVKIERIEISRFHDAEEDENALVFRQWVDLPADELTAYWDNISLALQDASLRLPLRLQDIIGTLIFNEVRRLDGR